jgi:hypothetical protein
MQRSTALLLVSMSELMLYRNQRHTQSLDFVRSQHWAAGGMPPDAPILKLSLKSSFFIEKRRLTRKIIDLAVLFAAL